MLPPASTQSPICVLYVDDEPALLEMGTLFLEREGNYRITTCIHAQDAIDLLAVQSFDAIISDYQMPDINGIQFLQHLRSTGDETPFIIFTGKGREEVVIEAVNSGADFYLQKGGDPRSQFAELSNKIMYAVARRKSELALQESEERYRSVVEDQTELICRFLPDRRIVFANDAFCRYYTCECADIIGKQFNPSTHPDDRERVARFFDALTPDQPSGTIDQRVIMPDGTILWQRWTTRAIFDENGICYQYQSVGRDVTETKEAELKLAHSHDLMRYIIEHNNASVAVHDRNLNYIYVSRRYLETYGVEMADVIGKHHYEVFPDLPEKWRDIHQKVLAGEGIFHADNDPYPRSDGTVEWTRWECRPWFESDGSIGGLIVYTEIITEQKQREEDLLRKNEELAAAEEELRSGLEQLIAAQSDLKEREAFIRAVLDNLPIGIAVNTVEPEVVFEYVNKNFLEIYRTTGEALQTPDAFWDVIYEDPHIRREIKERVVSGCASGDPDNMVWEDIPISREGEEITYISAMNIPLPDSDRMISTVWDVTNRKLAEERNRLYLKRVQELLSLHQIADATEQELLDQALECSLHTSESRYAFIGLLTPEGSEMIIHAWSPEVMEDCRVTGTPKHFPIASGGIWSECVRTHAPFVFNDYTASHPLKSGYPEGHVEIIRYLGVPIFDGTKIVAVLGVANKERDYSEDDVSALMNLGNMMWDIVHRKRVEEAMRESESLLRTAGRVARLGGWRADLATQQVIWSDEVALIHGKEPGYSPTIDEAISFYLPEWRETITRVFGDCARQGTPFDKELEITTAQGRRIWVRATGEAVRDFSGEIIRVHGATQDITDQKQTEEQIKNYLRRESDILNFLPDATFAIDAEGVVIAWNQAIEEMTGISADNILGKGNYEYALPFYRKRRPILVNLVLQRDPAIESLYPYIKRIGDTLFSEITIPHFREGVGASLWFTASPLYNEQGEVTGAIESIRDITDRKQTEEALRAEEGRMRAIADAAQDAILMMDPEGTISFWNQAATDIFGYSKDEVYGRDLHFMLAPERYHDAYRKGFGTFRITGEGNVVGKTLELEAIRKDGKEISIELSLSALHLIDGWHAVGIVRDITDRKQTEEALLREQEFNRLLLETIPAYFVAIGEDGSILRMNIALLEALDYRESDLIGKNYLKTIVPEEDHASLSQIFQQIISSGEITVNENTIISRSGRRLLVEWHGCFISTEERGKNFIVGIGIDITNRKATEEELHKLATVVKKTQELVNLSTMDGRMIYLNEAGCDMLGIEPDEVGNWNILDVISDHRKELVQTDVLPALRESRSWNGQLQYRNAQTGRLTDVQAMAFTLPDPVFGKPQFMVNISLDITEQKMAEEAFREANRKLNLLSSITRHDILNKIMTIKGFVECADGLTQERILREYLGQIRAASDVIEQQIEFTRQYEQLGVNDPTWLPLALIVERIDDSQLPLTHDCPGISIYADPMLEKVFSNLYENTLLHAKGATSIHMRCLLAGDNLLIIWGDDGAGIPDDQKERIFESGYGNHTGMGLFLVQEILAITRISIRETGQYGKGATFEICVPEGGFRIDN